MASDVNWGLVIASAVLVALLILVLIAGLYVLFSPPPASEPLGTPDGMLAGSRPGTILAAPFERLPDRYPGGAGSRAQWA